MINKKFTSIVFLSILISLSQLDVAQPNKEMDLVLNPLIPKHATAKPAKTRNILVFNCLNSYYHSEAILWASRAISLSGEKTGAYQTTESSDPAIFTKEKLAPFDAIVLNNSQGNIFGEENQADLHKQAIIEFVKEGKGLIALHATAAFDNTNPTSEIENSFRQLIGGSLLEHPWNYDEFSPITVRVVGPKNPVNAAFGNQQNWLQPV